MFQELAEVKGHMRIGRFLIVFMLAGCVHRDAGTFLRVSVTPVGDCAASGFRVVDVKDRKTVLEGDSTGREFSTLYMWPASEDAPEFELQLLKTGSTLDVKRFSADSQNQQKHFELSLSEGRCSLIEAKAFPD